MDQSSLKALLKQLQGLDHPAKGGELEVEEGQLSGEEHRGSATDGVKPEQPFEPSTSAAAAPLPGSELEQLLHSLRPLEQAQSQYTPTDGDALAVTSGYGSHYASLLDSYAIPASSAAPFTEPSQSSSSSAQAGLRKYTFVQALPVISRLAQDDDFLTKLQQASLIYSSEGFLAETIADQVRTGSFRARHCRRT